VESEQFWRFLLVFRLRPTSGQKPGTLSASGTGSLNMLLGERWEGPMMCTPVFGAVAMKEPLRCRIVHYEQQKFLAFFAIFLFFLFTLLRSIR
jgi:hypothetical protein